jgi:hypothetical protein
MVKPSKNTIKSGNLGTTATESKGPPKPRAPTTTSEQQVACYCVKNHCILIALDRGQCYHRKTLQLSVLA